VFNGPVELQAQFLQGDLALPIEFALEQNKGMKQVEGSSVMSKQARIEVGS